MDNKGRAVRKRTKILWALIIFHFILIPTFGFADDADIFTTSVSPDALIAVDWSLSMNWTPAGQFMYTNTGVATSKCTAAASVYNGPFYPAYDASHPVQCDYVDYVNVPIYSNPSCSGPFYKNNSVSGYTTDCTRVAIAKRAIFNLLDANADGQVISTNADATKIDDNILKVRIGYMSFYGCFWGTCPDCSPEFMNQIDYTQGCNKLIKSLGSKYSSIYCNNATQCSATTTCPSSDSCANYSGNANGGTPDIAALAEAKLYLDASKSGDTATACRQKFVILITDGEDTYGCRSLPGDLGGNPGLFHPQQYARRRELVARAKALRDANYKLFTVGFGADLSYYNKNTLNLAAYYGGTDNPFVNNSGNPGAFTPPAAGSCTFAQGESVNASGVYSPGVGITCKNIKTGAPCQTSLQQTAPYDNCYCYATSNDPGEIPLDGYGFFATNPAELSVALQAAINMIKESGYSFSVTSVSSSRTALDNHLYAASFQLKADPFWPGYLKEYTIDSNGNLQSSPVVDATIPAAGSRTIRTLKSGSTTLLDFTETNFDAMDIGFHDNSSPHDAQKTSIIGFIRGDSAYNIEGWNLGDIFHSNPVTITSPNPYFTDTRDTSSPNQYDQFRTGHQRTHDSGRIVIAGTNDGQLHAIRTSDMSELWSFVPPNLLPKLGLIAHNSHPTVLSHQFFVDGPISAGDVWLGTEDGQKRKSAAWNTLLVFGEGKGVRGTGDQASFLWSSSSNCAPTKDDDFGSHYSASYPYYCGYYALNVTNTSNPTYAWHLNPTASQAAYLDEPWSKMAMGKVVISGSEKWVGFIGGGYTNPAAYDVTDPTRDTRGKGFFVVDLSNGDILWSFTKANDDNMAYSIPASPLIVDTDSDGFIDTAYAGDLGGNMWRFTFCTNVQGPSCGTGSWSGGRFFIPSTAVPIYTAATFARDWNSNLWVFWGTGDKMTPNNPSSSSAGKFFAVKDNSRSGNWTESDLQDITGAMYTTDATTKGWYISLGSGGEKMLSDPTVFGGMLLFTTYLPYAGTNPCVTAGTAYLYAVAMQQVFVPGATYNTGAGLLGSGARSVSLGSGIASAPTIAQSSPRATSSLFVSVSGGSGIVDTTATTLPTVTKTKADFDSTSGLIKRLGETGVSTQILHWRDGRIQ